MLFLLLLLQAPSSSCKDTFDGALSALRQSNAAKASSILNSASVDCTQSSSFFELQGVVSDVSGDFTSAESNFEKAVSLQPNEPRLLAELGAVYIKNQKLPQAVDVLSRAFKVDPSNLAVGRYLIAAYVQSKQWQNAAQMFDDLGAGTKPGVLNPPVMILWFAQSLIETKRLSEVESRLSPTQAGMTPPILFSLGELFAQHKLYAQVITFLSRIPEQDADDAVSFNLGVAYSHLQKFEEARRCYFEAIDKHPGHPGAYLAVGADYASAGDSRRAIPWMARAHELAPDRSDVIYGLGEQLLQLDYLTSAEELLGGALQSHPADPLLLVGEGDVKAAQHQEAAALDLYRKALAEQPHFTPALLGLARADISQSKMDEAREALRWALSDDADNPAANGTLGLMESRQGDWTSAVTHLRRSWEKDHSNSEVLMALARAYVRTGQTPEALQLLAAEKSRLSNSAAYHLELSQVYAQLHRPENAQKEQAAFQALQTSKDGFLRFEKPQSYVF